VVNKKKGKEWGERWGSKLKKMPSESGVDTWTNLGGGLTQNLEMGGEDGGTGVKKTWGGGWGRKSIPEENSTKQKERFEGEVEYGGNGEGLKLQEMGEGGGEGGSLGDGKRGKGDKGKEK